MKEGLVSEPEKDMMSSLWNDGKSIGEISTAIKKKFKTNRSRSSVVGVLNRMKHAGDPRIVRGATHSVEPWSDHESLSLMEMRETKEWSFSRIGRALKKSSAVCAAHYAEIIRDLQASENGG